VARSEVLWFRAVRPDPRPLLATPLTSAGSASVGIEELFQPLNSPAKIVYVVVEDI